MMEGQQYYTSLLVKNMNGSISEEERNDLFDELRSTQDPEGWQSIVHSIISQAAKDPAYDPNQWAPVISGILTNEPSVQRTSVRSLRTKWIRYAAAIIILLGAGWLYRINDRSAPEKTNKEVTHRPQTQSASGAAGAVLTLADGSTVSIDSLKNGVVALQNGTTVLYRDGQLIYETQNADGIAYNTMSTPKGRTFQLQLPDGTKVWLNAASSITYPTAVKGDRRLVTVTGEVYFEVVKNKAMPFRVNIDGDNSVEVLGTHFNVNAYGDEQLIRTTLLEGVVQINSGSQSRKIVPGEQAIVTTGFHPAAKPIEVKRNIDLTAVMAWKNGVFVFENRSVKEILAEMGRWFDLEIVYENDIPQISLGGEMGRDVQLQTVLTFLQEAGLRFRIENNGKRMIVL